VGRDSSVGISTRYGLGGPGIESRWGGEIFRTRPYPPWGPYSLLYNGHRVSFSGVKRPGSGVNHPPPSSAEVKENVEFYFYFVYKFPRPVLRQNLQIYKSVAVKIRSNVIPITQSTTAVLGIIWYYILTGNGLFRLKHFVRNLSHRER
jgi:hypothetical protein